MTTPAADISEAIEFCADNIAELSYDGVVDIDARMASWIATLFNAPAGIFTDVDSVKQRRVIDWYAPNVQAREAIEAPGAGGANIGGTSAVIDAVSRTLCAVRAARVALAITQPQEDDVVAAFNAEWT